MAQTLPTEELRWATNVVQETVDINGKVSLVVNKLEPESGFKDSGFLARQKAFRPVLNWVLDLISQYIEHLVGRVVVGTIYTHGSNISTATVEAQMGGTWIDAGQTTTTGTGAKTVYHYEKTA